MILRHALRTARPALLILAALWVLWAGAIAWRTPGDAGNGWLIDILEWPTLMLGIVALIIVNWIRGHEAKG